MEVVMLVLFVTLAGTIALLGLLDLQQTKERQKPQKVTIEIPQLEACGYMATQDDRVVFLSDNIEDVLAFEDTAEDVDIYQLYYRNDEPLDTEFYKKVVNN